MAPKAALDALLVLLNVMVTFNTMSRNVAHPIPAEVL
jgi:hypothetical protein